MATTPPRPVPTRALVISLASLLVPVIAVLLLPAWAQEDQGFLVLLTVLVPAFVLAYYRGMRGVALAMAAGMAALTLSQVVAVTLGLGTPNWSLLFVLVTVYILMCAGIAAFATVLHRDRIAAEQRALTDALTKLPNRRHAELVLDQQFAAALRGRRLTVALFDIDRFKQVNDRNGHEAGDEVIQVFAGILDGYTRRMDLSARFGGEEFLAVLGDADLEDGVAFAERVRGRIKEHAFPWGAVTVSAGVAGYQEGMGTWEMLVAAADRALYAAKGGGRDRVVVADSFGARRSTPVPRVRPSEALPPSGGSGEAILVVDDDRHIVRTIVRSLERAGYRTEGLTDPKEALERYRAGHHPDLLLTDVVMPELSGLTLVDQVLAIKPDLRVVYMSGYLQRPVSWSGLPGAAMGFLEKPIEMMDLLDTVRQVLERQIVPASSGTDRR